jgi:ribosomal protein L11 methyltransferase
MSFLALSIDLVDGLDAGEVEAACFEAGALSITLSDMRDDAVLEPAVGEIRLWPATRVNALFAAEIASAPLIAGLGARLGLAAERLTLRAVADRVWEREWLRDFHAMRFGRRLWIAPLHEPVTDPRAIVVALDPGLAFGTGTHATTALCLEWLDAHAPVGAGVIDFGCGSGVLAIAAVKLGAAHAWGWDIDPQARLATRENAARNAVDDRLQVVDDAAALPRRIDLLLANILAQPLIALAPEFAARIRAGGELVVSGLLEAEAAEVTQACAPWFDMGSFGSRDGWTCLAGMRRDHDLS